MEKNTAFGVGGKKENHTGRYLDSLLQLLNQSRPTVVTVNLVHRPVDRLLALTQETRSLLLLTGGAAALRGASEVSWGRGVCSLGQLRRAPGTLPSALLLLAC